MGKSLQNEDLIDKVLRFLNSSWQPRVTAIFESKNLSYMDMPTLFDKLQKHEIELKKTCLKWRMR